MKTDRPKIVCLCGSTRFPDAHHAAMNETLAGNIVLAMGVYGHADFPPGAHALTAGVSPTGGCRLHWISEHYPTPESAKLKCAEATLAMCAAFPELIRIRGHVMVGIDFRPHWWCETPSGDTVDPTAHQWPGGVVFYERLESEEEPHGKCLNCGEEIFRSRNDSSFTCASCSWSPPV